MKYLVLKSKPLLSPNILLIIILVADQGLSSFGFSKLII